MFANYWLTGTTPMWTFVALAYCLASVYLRAFDRYDHSPKVWLTFLGIGTAIFLLINRNHFLGDTPLSGTIEYVAIGIIAVGGLILFHIARENARHRIKNADLKERLERYREQYELDAEIESTDNDQDGN